MKKKIIITSLIIAILLLISVSDIYMLKRNIHTQISIDTDLITDKCKKYTHEKKLNEYIKNIPEDALHPVEYKNASMTINFYGPSGKEDYYSIPMDIVVKNAYDENYTEKDYPYWIRDDGCKMFGDYIICAEDYDKYPYKSIIMTSLGEAIVLDIGGTLKRDGKDFRCDVDIATDW
jgi:flagellar basal body-associated protein FliL